MHNITSRHLIEQQRFSDWFITFQAAAVWTLTSQQYNVPQLMNAMLLSAWLTMEVEMSLNTPARTVGNSLLTAALSVSVPESWFPYRCAKNRPFWRSGLFRLTSGSEWLTAVTWTASRIRIGNLTNHCYLTATEKTTDLQNPAGDQDTIQEKTTYLVTN